MAPGPVTAATIAVGSKKKHAGWFISLGHGIVEFPLMIAIVLGAGVSLRIKSIQIGISIIGGLMLILMALPMIRVNKTKDIESICQFNKQKPILIGVMLSASNPYFLLWWATIGLKLTSQVLEFGIIAFALFAIVHWLCDIVWLEALSIASFKGAKLLSDKSQKKAIFFCGIVLLIFGFKFIYDGILK